MANNITTQSNGALPGTTGFRTRDTGSAIQASAVDVAPWVATACASGQYNLSVTTGAVVTLTPASGATHAWISVDTGGTATGIRFTFDGTTPSSTTGHFLAAGDALTYIDNLATFKMIGVTGTATVQVSYWKFV